MPIDDFHSRAGRSRRRTSRETRQDAVPLIRLTAVEVTLGLVVVVAPHLLAGVYAWGTAILAVATTLALGLALWVARGPGRLGSEPLVVVFTLMVTVTALHALPLPARFIAAFNPAAFSDLSELTSALQLQMPEWIAFTRDPAGTWERVLFGVGVLAAFCAARICASEADKTSPLLVAVALSALGIAVSHLGHRAIGASQVYGFYQPTHVTGTVGPILNPNNLAGFLALGLPLCLGLAIGCRGFERWAWCGAACTVATAGLLAGSRAGLLVLVGGPLFLGLMLWRGSRRSRRDGSREKPRYLPSGRSAVLTALTVCLMLVFTIGLAKLASDDFLDTDYQDLSKLDLIRAEARALSADGPMWWRGVGRGAFRVAFSPNVEKPVRFLHAECLPLQYAIEFGVPLAALFLLVPGYRIVSALSGWRLPAQLGALVGLVAVTLQNAVDYSLELPGIAVPAAVCLGAALRSSPRDEGPAHVPLVRASSVAFVLALGLTLFLSFPAGQNDLLVVEQRLRGRAGAPQQAGFWPLLKQSIVYHPADPVVTAFAGEVKMLENARDAPFWFNRVMAQAPGWSTPHMQAATWLAAHGRWEQAEDELRVATALDPRFAQDNLCAWLRAKPDAEFAVRLAPMRAPARVDTLDRSAACLATLAPEQSATVDAVLLREEPGHLSAMIRSARRYMERGDYADAIAMIRQLRQRAPNSAAAVEVEAISLVRWGQAPQALTLLKSSLGTTDDERLLLASLALAHAATGDASGMRGTIDQMRLRAAGAPYALAAVAALLSQHETTLGNPARALTAMLEAHRLSGSWYYLSSAAELATQLGQVELAARSWKDLCEEFPTNQVWCARRDQLSEMLKQREERDLRP